MFGALDDQVAVAFRVVGLEVRLEQVLVNPEFRTKQPECYFQSFRRTVELFLTQAFIVDALNVDDHANRSGLGEKAPVVNEAEHRALLGKSAGFFVILD